MIVWRRVRALVVCLVGLAGCSWQEQRIDDLFSDAEWDFLQTFSIERLERPIDSGLSDIGHALFFDPGISGPLVVTSDLGMKDEPGKVACARCHIPDRFFADKEALSLGTNRTGRNAPGLVDLAYRTTFTWAGEFSTIDDVLDLALRSAAAMNDKTHAYFIAHVRAQYVPRYPDRFPDRTDAGIYATGKRALGDYQRLLLSGPSPFDAYLAGDVDAIDAAAKRGAKLFIGKALCSECHDGPLFTDDRFHNTGVMQNATDMGHANGAFRTPTLRHVAKTGPYMHAGQLATLTDVIELYRWGGDPAGFPGVKDPRIQPLELTDADVDDLEAFLLTLTGAPPPAHLARMP